MKNKYIKVSHILESKFKEIVKLFAHDLSATQIASLTKLNLNTINRYLKLFRERIVEVCEKDSPMSEEVEVYESYFLLRFARNCKQKEQVEFEVKEVEEQKVKQF